MLNKDALVYKYPDCWEDYALIDSGNGEKLERFGDYILARPEPQALWDKTLSSQEWDKMSNAVFKKEKGNSEKGEWVLKKGMAEQWYIKYSYNDMKLKFRLGLSSFKHVGIFPEQADNWNFIYDKSKALAASGPVSVLNLFAYTGGASLAAKAAGAEVVHVDSVRQVINWGNDNMVASNLDNIRWVVEDAMKFVQREVRRGKIYQGIILDPPSYGRGPNGEKWLLEEQINEILKECAKLLDRERHFQVLNLYSLGFSPLIADNLVRGSLGEIKNVNYGEIFVPDQHGKNLPLGLFHRFSSIA